MLAGQDGGVMPAETPAGTSRQDSQRLPNADGLLLGRENELERLERRPADPACRLLTVVGVGGVGKIRLAIEAAERSAQSLAESQ